LPDRRGRLKLAHPFWSPPMRLVIGNKNYSSWSLRPWLLMQVKGIAFEETRVALYQPESKAALLQHSPAGKVPTLIDGEVTVWDSLAIVEYLAERFPTAASGPPTPSPALARARSVRRCTPASPRCATSCR
jgi:Glutathione S-transferase